MAASSSSSNAPSQTMDIVRAFEAAGLERGVTINIQGTHDDPLFQAKQIGELLGIANIRETLRDFDEDELRVSTTDTSAGPRQATFLTELGLYRLLGMSRKPFARPFQKWVGKVIKEIRLNGKYELQRALEAKDAALKELTAAKDAEVAAKDAEVAAKDAEVAAHVAKVAEKDAELERFRSKTYEQLPCVDSVYICKEASQLGTDKHKIGKTIDETKRESTFNCAQADGSKMIRVCKTTNGKLVEDVIKHALKRYHHAREHYNCRVEHTVDCMDVASCVIDTLASSYEFMSREALFNKVFDELIDRMNEVDGDYGARAAPGALRLREADELDEDDDEDEDEDEDQSSDPRAEAISEFIDANVDFNPVRTDGQRGHKVLGCVRRTDLIAAIKSLPAIARTKVGELKILVDAAMLRRGRKLCDEVQCGGRTVALAYKGCVLALE